jgi:hypothetical protein
MFIYFSFIIFGWYAGFPCPEDAIHRKSIYRLNFGVQQLAGGHRIIFFATWSGKVLGPTALLTEQILGCFLQQ